MSTLNTDLGELRMRVLSYSPTTGPDTLTELQEEIQVKLDTGEYASTS